MKLLILLVLCSSHIFAENYSNHRVNLDDIERDNLLSEKLAQDTKDDNVIDVQQLQTFHTKNLEYYRQQLKELKELQEKQQTTTEKSQLFTPETKTSSAGIVNFGSTTPSYNAYKYYSSPRLVASHYSTPAYQPHRYQNAPEDYVTIAPKPKYQYQHANDAATSKAVHEESSPSYSANSRETLSRPVSPTIASYLQRHPQPQYVYVQSSRLQPKAIQHTQYRQPANDVQYAATASGAGSSHGQVESPAETQASSGVVVYSHNDGSASVKDDQQAEQQIEQQPTDKQEATEDDQQQVQPPYQLEYQPNYVSDANQQADDVRYVPYIGQGPTSLQSYITMVSLPASFGHKHQPIRFTPSVITYSHSSPAAVTPVVGGIRPGIQYLSQTLPAKPTGPLQYVNSNDISEPVPTLQYVSQLQDIQYVDEEQTSSKPSVIDGSKQFIYAPRHPERVYPQKIKEGSSVQEQPQLHTKIQYLPSQRVVPLQQAFQYVPQAPISVQPLQQFQPFRGPKSLLESYVPSWIVIQRQQQQQQQLQQHYLLQQRSLNHQNHQRIGGTSPQHINYNTIAYSTQQNPSGYTTSTLLKRAATISNNQIEKDKTPSNSRK